LMLYAGSQDAGSFIETGNEFLGYLKKYCLLKPDHTVMEAGCGCGRMALPLAYYLSPQGKYCGFDIDRRSIDWAKEHITGKRPNIRFDYAPVYNHYYNPEGTTAPEDYIFPYESGSFDVIFLTSVFTHLMPEEMDHYISEISRVLKPDGKCLITFFILDREAKISIRKKTSSLPIVHKADGFWTSNPSAPGETIGYEKQIIKKTLKKHSLFPEKIYPGCWCKRSRTVSYQDIVIASKSRGKSSNIFGNK
jgi:SAM-dependent methyltransferase